MASYIHEGNLIKKFFIYIIPTMRSSKYPKNADHIIDIHRSA